MTELTSREKDDWKGDSKSHVAALRPSQLDCCRGCGLSSSVKRRGLKPSSTGADHFDVVRDVVDAIAAAKHVRANLYLDDELRFVFESDAPGIAVIGSNCSCASAGMDLSHFPHEQIIAQTG